MRRRQLQWVRRVAPNWRFAFVSFSLLATMGITMFAAYQLHVSLHAHDESVDHMLAEYARYTSRTFGEALMRHAYGTRLAVMAAPTILAAEGPAMPLPQFAEHAVRAFATHGIAEDEWLGFVRFDMEKHRLEGSGSALQPAVLAAVDSLLKQDFADGSPSPVDAVRHFDIGGEPLTLSYTVPRTRSGAATVAFGYVASRRHVAAAQAQWVMNMIPLYPPSMISPGRAYDDPIANDSLLSVEILDHRGVLLFRSPRHYVSAVAGDFMFRTEPGGFTIRSTLSPRVVEEIRAVHYPDRSRHFALVLPFISLILGTSAIIHLLQERELVRTRRNFVASVSHELRTPLAQIQIMAETLLRGRERSASERMHWLGVISREAYRMAGLVENILMFSHLERDELRLAREPTDLAALVVDVVDTFEPLADARRARISVDAADEVLADIDPRAVRQVVGNLLDNALKYGPTGQTVRIMVTSSAGERVATLVVEDDGPGVPLHERDDIWQPFHRASDNGGSAGGSGLGLAVVRSLVAHHGGTARVTDAAGGGARFVVTLPLLPRAATTALALDSSAAVPAATSA